MRMWMVDPRLMCRQHLLGEHVEIHMLVATIRLGKSISGFVRKKIIQPFAVLERHNALVEELKRRGYRHNSNLVVDITEILKPYPIREAICRVDVETSMSDLFRRCPDCAKRMVEFHDSAS